MAEYYINLPPIDDLTPPQRLAVNTPNPVAISGPAGSGKSIVSLYRHIGSNNSQLLTYTRTLAIYLSACCKTRNPNAANNVCSIHSWIWCYLDAPYRTEIIIDEAQDLGYAYKDNDRGENRIRLTWETQNQNKEPYQQINIHSEYFAIRGCRISYGADNAQLLSSKGITQEELRIIYPQNELHPLSRNFRNTKCILRFAQACFPESNITDDYIESCRREGEKPIFIKTDNDISQILDIIKLWNGETENIAILFPWGKEVKNYYEKIREVYPEATYFVSDKDASITLSNLHLTTFKSAKGLEFDTVIIPNFNKRYENLSGFNITWRDYYVGITRAKTNLYLLDSQNLSADLQEFIEEEA